MRFLITTLAAAVIVGPDETEPAKQVLADWEHAQREIRSLVVEFTREDKDRIFGNIENRDGVFRLLRGPKGEIHASFDLLPAPSNQLKQERFTALLNDRTISLLDYKTRTELRLDCSGKDLFGFLEDYFNPLAVLLDRKRAEKKCQLEVERDEHYTYLSIRPKEAKPSGSFGFPPGFMQGRIALANEESGAAPRGVPCQLWYAASVTEVTFQIRSWRTNAGASLKVEDFTSPRHRADWKVGTVDWSQWPIRNFLRAKTQ